MAGAIGVLTPETPEDQYGDAVLLEFTQLDGLTGQVRKRQRIDVYDEDDDEEDGRANKRGRVDAGASCGIIEKIEMANFMCHDHFELELGPQINFIIGQNGSGKSAVLTAISVGLGAKASETNRGSSLKLLIKNGCKSSRISITFRNEGEGSYKPEIFGKKIVVQRILRTEGLNKYSLRSESGKHVSDKKLDLDAMLTSFGITVNNPMAILTQDHAKSFIATASDEEKYKFFMSGTKVDETIKNYQETLQELSKVKERVALLNTDLRELRKLESDTRVIFDRFESQDELIKMKTIHQGKFLWVQVRDKQTKLERANEKLSDYQEEIDAAKSHIAEREERKRANERLKQDLTEKSIQFSSRKQEAEEKLNSMITSVKLVESELKQALSDIKSVQLDLDLNTKKLLRLKQQVIDEQSLIDRINGGSHELLESQKVSLQNEISVLNRKSQDLEAEKLSIRDEFANRKQELELELLSEKKTKQNMEHQLQQLRGSEDRRLDAFGKQIYGILNDIENDKGYHSKPIGPLGRFVNLRQGEEKWSSLLESNLSKSLSAFVVEDQHDFHRLSNLFRRYRYKASIVTKKREIFDFLARSASSSFKRIIDVLTFQDKFIECVLVDLNNINRIVLEAERHGAEKVIRAHGKELNSILVPYDSRTGNQLKMNRFGGLQIDVIHYRNDLEKIGSEGSSEERALRLEQNLAKISRGIHILESNVRNLRDERIQKEFELKQSSNDTTKLISRKEREINEINNKLEETGNTGKIEALNEQIIQIRRESEIKELQMIDTEIRYEEIRSKLHEKHELYKDFAQKVKMIRESDKESASAISQLQSDFDTMVKEIRHFEQSILKREGYIVELETYIEEELQTISELTARAEECCSRSEANLKEGDTMESIESNQKHIENELSEFEKHVGITREEAYKSYEKARNDYKQASDKMTSVSKLKDNLQKSLDDRLLSFEQMRIDICNKVNDSFQKSLMLRQFTGEIKFDFGRGKLTMMVSTKKNEKLRNIESFSGGEKSYSQIALLLAIWDFMNTKIRGLDEFDVFMDQVNRRLSLRLILEKIKKSSSQTIFITPLDIAGLEEAEVANVHIHRIADPRKS